MVPNLQLILNFGQISTGRTFYSKEKGYAVQYHPQKQAELSPEERMWAKYINWVLANAIELYKKGDSKKPCSDYTLLLEFFGGDEEQAGAYFVSYCCSVSKCPENFLNYCEAMLVKAGIELVGKPLVPRVQGQDPYLQAAE